MRQSVGGRAARALLLGSATLLAAVGVAAATAPAALAGEIVTPPPTEPPTGGEDGSCETRPTTYPADGSPIAAGAACVVISDASGVAVGETWTWQDDDSIQWYAYPAGDVPSSGGTVLMCGSTTAPGVDGTYVCTANSTYLLFAVSGVFVEWPTATVSDLYFCQNVSFGAGVADGNACGVIPSAKSGAEPPAETPTAPPPTAAPTEPTSETTSAPPVEPSPGPSSTGGPAVDEPADDPDATTPTSTGGAGSEPGGGGAAPTTAPADVATSAPSATPRPGEPGSAEQTPLSSESLAVVGGSRFPMLMVLVLAGGLALGGYATLAGPGLLAARRRRH